MPGRPVQEAIEFGVAGAGGELPPQRAPVRPFVMGEEAWRDFDPWPPAGYAPHRVHLRPIRSLSGADAINRADVRLWPTAHRFKRGHRIRIQVSSSAFLRFARNPDIGEPHTTAITLRPADREVYRHGERPSAIILPVAQGEERGGPPEVD